MHIYMIVKPLNVAVVDTELFSVDSLGLKLLSSFFLLLSSSILTDLESASAAFHLQEWMREQQISFRNFK